MQMSITVYFNTGFNSVDIPATPAVLNNAQQKTYNDVYFLREDIDNTQVKINDNYNNLVNVDYVRLYNNTTNSYSYYFATPHAEARNTTILYLSLDALTTMGGAANLNYISGFQTRGHIKKEDDVMFSNIASEDFMPIEEMEQANLKEQKTTGGIDTDLKPVMCNIDLEKLAETPETTMDVINGIVEGQEDAVMYIPRLNVPDQFGTDFFIKDINSASSHGFSIPNTYAYETRGEQTKSGLQKLYSFGQLQLQCSYTLPAEWINDYAPKNGSNNLPDGHYETIIGIEEEQETNIPYKITVPGYTIKNNKCHTMYRFIHLCNVGNGNESIKRPSELYDANNEKIKIVLFSDPAPGGKPYGRFKTIKNNHLQFADAVSGLCWANNQITTEGASGNIWNAMTYAFQNQALQREQETINFQREYNLNSQVRTGMNMTIPKIAGVGGALAGMNNMPSFSATDILGQITKMGTQGHFEGTKYLGFMGSFQQAVDLQNFQTEQAQKKIIQQNNENYITALRNENIAAPNVMFTPEINLGLYGYNYFITYEIKMSNNDIIALDRYFQRYGYNGLHKPLTADCFNARQYYSFVQAFDINIKNEHGMRVRERGISQLNNGVRVWKVLPDASYYDLN